MNRFDVSCIKVQKGRTAKGALQILPL